MFNHGPAAIFGHKAINAYSRHNVTATGILLPVKDKGIKIVPIEIKHREKNIHNAVAHPPLGILVDSIVGIPTERTVTREVVKLTQRSTTDPDPRLNLLHATVHGICNRSN